MDSAAPAQEDSGFTLIELMVVVLVVAVLLAIAIPTFLGARGRASDRAAQSNLRNAHTNELVWIADNKDLFTSNTSELRSLDASLNWTDHFPHLTTQRGSVYVKVDVVGTQSAVIVGSQSQPGKCYWLRAVVSEDHPRFAQNDCAAEPASTDFTTSWG